MVWRISMHVISPLRLFWKLEETVNSTISSKSNAVLPNYIFYASQDDHKCFPNFLYKRPTSCRSSVRICSLSTSEKVYSNRGKRFSTAKFRLLVLGASAQLSSLSEMIFIAWDMRSPKRISEFCQIEWPFWTMRQLVHVHLLPVPRSQQATTVIGRLRYEGPDTSGRLPR